MKDIITVVLPVYNNSDSILELYNQLKDSFAAISVEYEIIMVEDCGSDDSWEKISSLALRDQNVIGLKLSRNFGQHYAITAGLDISRGNYVVVMDADLQDEPKEIKRLYEKIKLGFDVVIAKSQKRRDAPLKKIASICFYKFLNILTGMNYHPEVRNYRILSRKVVDYICSMREQMRFFGALVNWLGFNVAFIEVESAKRFSGKSSYTFKKLLTLALSTIIAYSNKPLQISIYIGFFLTLTSTFLILIIIFNYLFFQHPVAGWTSLILSIFFTGGIIIFLLGVIGIYIGKIYDETKKRPLYVIDKKLSQK